MIPRIIWPADTSLALKHALDQLVDSLMRETNRANNLSVYVDNTAAKAGGLTDGMLYRTSAGVVMVVYT